MHFLRGIALLMGVLVPVLVVLSAGAVAADDFGNGTIARGIYKRWQTAICTRNLTALGDIMLDDGRFRRTRRRLAARHAGELQGAPQSDAVPVPRRKLFLTEHNGR